MKYLVAGVCAYEAAAICSGKAPTVSDLCARRQWRSAVVLAALGLHFLTHKPKGGKLDVEDWRAW